MSYAQLCLTKLKKRGSSRLKQLKIDPRSASGASLWPLIDKKVTFRDTSITQNRLHVTLEKSMVKIRFEICFSSFCFVLSEGFTAGGDEVDCCRALREGSL